MQTEKGKAASCFRVTQTPHNENASASQAESVVSVVNISDKLLTHIFIQPSFIAVKQKLYRYIFSTDELPSNHRDLRLYFNICFKSKQASLMGSVA